MEAFSLQKVVEMLEQVVVSWWEIRWIWRMKQNFVAHFVQPLKRWLCGHCRREELGPFFWPMLAAGIAVSGASWCTEHASKMYCFHENSESYSGSDRQQTPKQWLWPFFGASLALISDLELLLHPTTELVVTGCCIKYTFCCTSQSDWETVPCYWVE